MFVVDSWPVMEWLKDRQPAAGRFEAILNRASDRASASGVRLIMSTMNLGEVYYNCWGTWGATRADEVVRLLREHPIQMVHPTPSDVIHAARIKAIYRCSYADGFAASLGIAFGGAVLTGDPDFLRMRGKAAIEIEWIGS